MNITKTISDYYQGNTNLLDALISLEKEREILEAQLQRIKDFKQQNSEEIEIQAKEYKEGYKGFRFEVKSGRVTYDFKSIPEWSHKNKEIKELEKKYKAALNAKINGLKYANIDEDGAEMILPNVKYSKPSVIVKKM